MKTLASNERKARKAHRCDYCNGIINVKELYYNSSHTDGNGSVYTWKAHTACSNLASNLGWFDDGDGLGPDDFNEYVQNAFQDIHIKIDVKYYESSGFKYPSFEDQLKFVIKNQNLIIK